MPMITVALFLAMFFLVSHSTGSLHAYLDPGTGSVALQLILGGMVAGLATLRLYWDRVKSFVQRKQVESGAGSEER
jgi:hypothetical protein